MPREYRKRGKRGGSERKRARDESDDPEDPAKRRRTIEPVIEPTEDGIELQGVQENLVAEDDHDLPDGTEQRFYGLLDDQEQEYFKRADEMLEVNQFRDGYERSLFIDNLHKEASGKELKLACSQGSSRLMERLILLSSPEQLKSIFQQFQGEYVVCFVPCIPKLTFSRFSQLIFHRFASHCCETLFVRAAPIVTDELAAVSQETGKITPQGQPSMEKLFIDLAYEIDVSIGNMITHRYASHVLRILLVVYAGHSLDDSDRRTLLASRRKEHVKVTLSASVKNRDMTSRPVPQSFLDTLQYTIEHSVNEMEMGSVRAIAMHKTGNPVLQLLLQLELTSFGKSRAHDPNSIIKKLLPEEGLEEGSGSASFINGILFDPVGSHLLETLVKHVPGKNFKTLYKQMIQDRLSPLSRNATSSYVVCRVLERLGSQDLKAASDALLPEVSTLAERGRTNVLQALAERLTIREVDLVPFAEALKAAYDGDGNKTFSLQKLLQIPDELPDLTDTSQSGVTLQSHTSSTQNAASFFAQALLKIPGPLSSLVFDSLTQIEPSFVKHIALTPTLSPILQVALTSDTASVIFRRKLITHLYGSLAWLSTSSSGSHVVDAVEVGSRKDLAFVRERVAEELAENETAMRNSFCGRKVWKNWDMDLYSRDRGKWVRNTRHKVGNNGFQSFPGLLGETDMAAREKGKGPLSRLHTAVSEAVSETKQNTKEAVHENICEPVRETGKSALDRARERYAHKHPQNRSSSRSHLEKDIDTG